MKLTAVPHRLDSKMDPLCLEFISEKVFLRICIYGSQYSTESDHMSPPAQSLNLALHEHLSVPPSLPQHVIEELTKRVTTLKPSRCDKHMATSHEQVTILFADLVSPGGCAGQSKEELTCKCFNQLPSTEESNRSGLSTHTFRMFLFAMLY